MQTYRSWPMRRALCLPALLTALLLFSHAFAETAQGQGLSLPQAASPDAIDPDAIDPNAIDDGITLTLPRTLSASERDALIGALVRHGATVVIAEGGSEAPGGADADTASGSLAMQFEQGFADFEEKFAAMFSRTGDLPSLVAFWADRVSQGPGGIGVVLLLLGLAVSLAIGAAAEWAVLRFTGAWRESYEAASPPHFTAKLRLGLSRLARRVSGLVVFVVVALLASRLVMPLQEALQVTVAVVVGAVAVIRLALMILRFLVAPRLAALRLVPADDRDAKILFQWLALLAIVRGTGLASLVLLTDLGAEDALIVLYQFCAASIAKVIEITVYFKIARPVGDLIRKGVAAGQPVGPVREVIARTWHIFLIVVSLVIFAMAVYASVRGLELDVITASVGTRAVIILFPLIGLCLGACIGDLFAPGAATDEDAAALKRGYARVTRRIFYGLLTLVGIVLIANLWGASLFAGMQSTVGAKIAGALIEIAAVVLIAYVVWEIAKIAIDRHIGGDEAGDAPVGDIGGTGVSRIATMLPVIRLFLAISLVVVTVMVVLSALGVDIGPLLAGAGVVGLAIGFGAQTLVRDIISGMFFLMDDAFRRGEYIDVGSVMGTVERISIRSMQLRHHNGPVHTVPFGEITSLTNYSRDWAIIKFELRLPFETDIDKVRKIIKKVGLAMMEDEELGSLMLQPLKSQGVNRMDDSSLIIRCKLMAQPGQQFYVRREAFSRIQRAFAEQGINFAPRRVIVETTAPPQAAAAAAVAAEAQDPQAETTAADPV